jgi:hypothetical protein
METMTVDQILQAIGNLRSADRVRLVSQMAPSGPQKTPDETDQCLPDV